MLSHPLTPTTYFFSLSPPHFLLFFPFLIMDVGCLVSFIIFGSLVRMAYCDYLYGKGSGAGGRNRRTTCILIVKAFCERVVWFSIDRPYPGLKIICQHYVCLQSLFVYTLFPTASSNRFFHFPFVDVFDIRMLSVSVPISYCVALLL